MSVVANRKILPHRESNPGRLSRSLVSVPSELTGPTRKNCILQSRLKIWDNYIPILCLWILVLCTYNGDCTKNSCVLSLFGKADRVRAHLNTKCSKPAETMKRLSTPNRNASCVLPLSAMFRSHVQTATILH